jgi:hypothetical protein
MTTLTINPEVAAEWLSVDEAARTPPRPVSRDTIIRWMDQGTRGQRLGFIRQGGRRFTTKSEIFDFLRRTTEAGE